MTSLNLAGFRQSVARPEQVAAAITWLLSEDASNVSGAVMPVDGGWAAI